ncbi:MAG TPA: glycoside hydrolase domain-containing protein [Streptosporangiaceae bacterium]
MLGRWPSRSTRHAPALAARIAWVGVVLPGIVSAGPGPNAAGLPAAAMVSAHVAADSAGRFKPITYRGYMFKVPAAWPVLNLARHPGTCVRFDRHAVYLGTPGANEHCPSWLLGSTEALVIQPGARQVPRTSVENPVAHLITVRAPRIRVTGTFNTDPTVIDRALESAGLPAPAIEVPTPGRLAAGAAVGSSAGQANSSSPPVPRAIRRPLELITARDRRASPPTAAAFGVSKPALPALVANDRGLGFDTCAAPSAPFMAAWRRYSPYRAVGIYIGGSDRACYQANLTPDWVRREAAAGWRFIPMYVGPQASFGQLTSPATQGAAAARDAVAQAQWLGFGPGTPIYYDMEAYSGANSVLALGLFSAWTTELHRLGYASGVYSSSASGIVDLARHRLAATFAGPDVIYDALWNGLRNTSDAGYGRTEWTGGRRLHQYSGNVFQTFGGDTMNIDQDYLDLILATPGGTTQAAPAAAEPRAQVAAFYKGSDHRLWEVSRSGNGGWQHTDLGGSLTSAPTVVQVNTAELDVFYRGGGGYLWQRRHTAVGWQPARKLGLMGSLGGGPRAVAQPNGVIDVFWKGSNDNHLWHGQYSPGERWTGPQNLHGSLATWPYPVETRSGQVQVFWRGTDGNLWHVVRGLGLPFTRPVDLGMGPLGGAPQAVALPSGEIDIFWRGKTRPIAIWAAVLRGHQVSGPARQGGLVSGDPWPVVAACTELILYRGRNGRLWAFSRLPGGLWAPPSVASTTGSPRSQPFAATGPPGAPLEVFWTAADGHLLAAGLTKSGHWERPVDLGGSVG